MFWPAQPLCGSGCTNSGSSPPRRVTSAIVALAAPIVGRVRQGGSTPPRLLPGGGGAGCRHGSWLAAAVATEDVGRSSTRCLSNQRRRPQGRQGDWLMLSDMPASLAIHPPDVCPIDRSQHSNMSTDKAGYCFPPGTVSNGLLIQ